MDTFFSIFFAFAPGKNIGGALESLWDLLMQFLVTYKSKKPLQWKEYNQMVAQNHMKRSHSQFSV